MAKLGLFSLIFHVIIIVSNIQLQLTSCESSSLNLETDKDYRNVQSQRIEINSFEVFTKIRYRYARTMVFCQMLNTHPTQGQETMFKLHLPKEAFISNFTMETDDGQQYKSFIKEREKANDEYSRIRGSGATTAIINEDNGVDYNFNVSINLAANSSVLFFLEYEEEIPKIHNGPGHKYQYVLNLIPEVHKVKHFCVDIDILEYKPFAFTSVNLCNKHSRCVPLNFQKDATIFSNKQGNRTRIIWESSPTGKLNKLTEFGLVGTFKLDYHFESQESINDVVVRNGYFVHRFDWRNATILPLYVVFVLDASGSMIGSKGIAMKRAMKKILSDLNPEKDFFHIITFSSLATHWDLEKNRMNRFYPASLDLQKNATEYINEAEFGGSTNIYDALMEALGTATNSSYMFQRYCDQLQFWGVQSDRCSRQVQPWPSPSPMILFLTDGYPTTGIRDRLTILKTVKKINQKEIPIFSIGLGNEADHSLLHVLSAQNHGIARKIYHDAEVELQLEDFYKLVASPILKDVKFQYSSSSPTLKTLQVSYDSDLEHWLTSNEEIVVIGRLEKQLDGPSNSHLENIHGLKFEGYTAFGLEGQQHAEFKARVCPCGICHPTNKSADVLLNFKNDGTLCPRSDDDQFMQRFWLHKTLINLIKRAIASRNGTIKQEIVSLSKKYNLVTPFTSLVVRTPLDTRGSDSKDYNSPSVPEMPSDPSTNKISAFSTSSDKSSKPKRINYNVSPQMLTTLARRTSLISYLEELRQTQDDAFVNYGNGSAAMQSSNRLTINDITWIVGEHFSLHLMNKKNESHIYRILRNITDGSLFNSKQKCVAKNTKLPGRCVHLAQCVESDYLTNVNVFVKSCFCPITESNEKYIGTCCTSLDTQG